MVVEQNREINLDQLNRFVSQDNIIVLKWSPDLSLELEALTNNNNKRLFEAILIDATESGFLFPAEQIIDACGYLNHLLAVNGALLFLKDDKAFAIVRETLMGSLSFHVFNNILELFDYSPSLAKQAQAVLGTDTSPLDESTDLSKQVLMSAIPVLTLAGIKLKGGIDTPSNKNCVLAAVDNYTPLGTISERLTGHKRLTHDQLLEEMKELEKAKAIFPFLAKIDFLVNCFRQQTPFTLKDYLVAAKLMTPEQIDTLVLEAQSLPMKERSTIGPLAVKKGFISARQLEVSLQDQAFYGQSGERDKVKLVKSSDDASQVQSLVGHLGTTDPCNLVQNLATNRESGVLSVEYRDLNFRAVFEMGRLTRAKMGKIHGNRAISEFASAWKEGIFVFTHRTTPADLTKEICLVTKPLDKLLLDAALAQDNTDVVLKKLPKDLNSLLEKAPDDDNLLNCGELIDPQEERPLKPEEVDLMKRTHAYLDGLTTLQTVIRQLGDVTTAEAAKAIDLLLHYELAIIPEVDLQTPLTKFKMLTRCVSEKITAERSTAYLRLALRDGIGFSQRARVFALTPSGDVGVDMAAAKQAATSLSAVVQDLESWQIKYIEYVSQDIKRDELLELIQQIHGS
jgi:hypothetical protein